MSAYTWKIKFYGVRGSIPVCSPSVKNYGGNTTCFHIDLLVKKPEEKVTVIFDAGTGIRQLGKDIVSGAIPKTKQILLAFSHFHWDHIQGLPFFAPAYNPEQQMAFFAPHFLEEGKEKLHRVFKQQMQSEYFPVEFDKMGAQMCFFTTQEFQEALCLDRKVQISYYRHNHPGGAYSYRMDGYGKSVVICTDIEHGEGIDSGMVDFCKNADLLVHEAQYTDDELASHKGWGHSSFNQAIAVAEKADVKRLYITHHDPDHDDDFLEKAEQECRSRFPNCTLAREGSEVFV